jgi:hypothetical protein
VGATTRRAGAHDSTTDGDGWSSPPPEVAACSRRFTAIRSLVEPRRAEAPGS